MKWQLMKANFEQKENAGKVTSTFDTQVTGKILVPLLIMRVVIMNCFFETNDRQKLVNLIFRSSHHRRPPTHPEQRDTSAENI